MSWSSTAFSAASITLPSFAPSKLEACSAASLNCCVNIGFLSLTAFCIACLIALATQPSFFLCLYST
ncbi:hypothetical protein [Candidatus Phytoplasma pruni]|uniref:hypothetical protein n=1 Tax=Candidatus Phytoplasma pruni TaxID=479893 RepID=UPI00128BCDDB|nr:hypothetical protein [Candidatus Phytoplasma pruni]